MMVSSWVLKTRQMSEAGKEILLREALASHMRSSRDRQLFHELLKEPRPLEDVFSFFAAFYLHSYQGIRLLTPSEVPSAGSDMKDELGAEERRQLELEVRQFFSGKQREEIDVAKLVSELIICFVDELGGANPNSDSKDKALNLLKETLKKIPSEYNSNHDIDLILEVTGWGQDWRQELYVKASGLKESALSLRDELLREHPSEVPETTILKMGLEKIFGRIEYSKGHIFDTTIPIKSWDEIASTITKRFCKPIDTLKGLRNAHEIRLHLLEVLEKEFDIPTTLENYESRLGQVVTTKAAEILSIDSDSVLDTISKFLNVDIDDVKAQLRRKGISDLSIIGPGLKSLTADSTSDSSAPAISKEELEMLERSLKALEKIENTLNGPVKGMLRSKGLRATELDKISIDMFTKDRAKLVGIEIEVLEALNNKMRVPPPAEVIRLLETREQVKSGALSSLGISSARDFSQQRTEDETIVSLRLDFIWHFTIGILTNLTRVVESYIRSKQDLLRIKALLKSIYEDTDTTLQFLREEILIDLASMRIYEMKIVYPELDAQSICTWMHARFSTKDMIAAAKDLETSISPVFEGIVDKSLDMTSLEFDNYAIAYDIMQRFLKQERLEKLAKEEFAFEAKQKEKRRIEERKEGIDVLMYLHNKARTVFRAISRVGAKGLVWTPNDTTKCANLLAYYIKTNRGRKICSACGSEPSNAKCSQHGVNFMKDSSDMDNLSIFIMRSLFEIKEGLIGTGRGVEPMSWDKAKSTIDREIGILKRKGKLTSKTNLKELMPGEINYVVGPAICAIVGKYFNESLTYAARRADIA
ncbi:MAG: hypothetical protein AM325_001670 [Candidatus Thorarchaeota archaeon SMTZ1-45]|nr:MAG: hypothetical protein AM325_03480 [Candidatus Thorarchaeota archaeon SMTZ1-45]